MCLRITCPPHSAQWVVLADWFGAERPVFRGSLFGCLAYVKEQSS
jgi:hypothetical protein